MARQGRMDNPNPRAMMVELGELAIVGAPAELGPTTVAAMRRRCPIRSFFPCPCATATSDTCTCERTMRQRPQAGYGEELVRAIREAEARSTDNERPYP